MSQTEDLRLAATFPSVDPDEWRRAVLAVLRKSGAADEQTAPDRVDELLSTKTYEGIRVAPVYTADTPPPETGLPGLYPFVRGSRPLGAKTAGWDIRQRHAHTDPVVTREEALKDLENGAGSVWIVLGDGLPGPKGLADLLKDVRLDLAGIVLEAGALTRQAAGALIDEAVRRGVSFDALTGTFGADPIGLHVRTGAEVDLSVLTDLAVRCAADLPGMRAGVVDATAYHDAGGSDAEELGCALATGVAYLRAAEAAGLDIEAAFGQLEFRYAATADQFLSIAKLRAARRLWARIAQASGVPQAGAQLQHAVTSSAMMTARDPWVNMLRTTMACFSAAVGGADAITVQPFDTRLGLPDGFSRRIARNTQSLLLMEAHLGEVVDPAGGSWYVEQLTEDLAQAAWKWFTELEAAGGILPALDRGLVAERIDATWQARQTRIARRKDPITGVSEFPNLTEELPERVPAPEIAGGLLPRRHYACLFEDFRDRADAHERATGARPAVFFATLGSISAHTARASFAGNMFAAGGIANITSGTTLEPAEIAQAFRDSGLTVACLCSTDKIYAEHAAAVAGALKEAGATKVWLAGKPGDHEGVDSYLYLGCDAAAVVDTTLRDLEVAAK
jgi:methylmalonyl-CoA mutase